MKKGHIAFENGEKLVIEFYPEADTRTRRKLRETSKQRFLQRINIPPCYPWLRSTRRRPSW